MRIFDEGLMPDFDKGMLLEKQPALAHERRGERMRAALAIAALVALLVLAVVLKGWRYLPHGLYS